MQIDFVTSVATRRPDRPHYCSAASKARALLAGVVGQVATKLSLAGNWDHTMRRARPRVTHECEVPQVFIAGSACTPAPRKTETARLSVESRSRGISKLRASDFSGGLNSPREARSHPITTGARTHRVMLRQYSYSQRGDHDDQRCHPR